MAMSAPEEANLRMVGRLSLSLVSWLKTNVFSSSLSANSSSLMSLYTFWYSICAPSNWKSVISLLSIISWISMFLLRWFSRLSRSRWVAWGRDWLFLVRLGLGRWVVDSCWWFLRLIFLAYVYNHPFGNAVSKIIILVRVARGLRFCPLRLVSSGRVKI